MKRLLLFFLLSGFVLASAAQSPPGPSDEAPGGQFALPSQAYPILPRDLETYTGAYLLSNGERMTIRQAGRRIYAAIGSLPTKELVASAPNAFVALDRQVRMRFDDQANGDTTGELLMITPRTLGQQGGDVIRLSVR